MRLSILGATGQIGRSLTRLWASRHSLTLLARKLDQAAKFLVQAGLKADVRPVEALPDTPADLIVNAAGAGVPGQIRRQGFAMLEVTAQLDALCVAAQQRNPGAGYVFLSTGAIYGRNYHAARESDPMLPLPLTGSADHVAYPLAKRLAELRHRGLADAPIADIRIFGYVSSDIDLDSDFLVAQMLRAARAGKPFATRPDDVPRDFIDADSLGSFIDHWHSQGRPNGAYDVLSAAPTSKHRLLDALAEAVGLVTLVDGGAATEPMDLPRRLSTLAEAEPLGWQPPRTSEQAVLKVAQEVLSQASLARAAGGVR